MSYQTIFEATSEPYRNLTFLIPGLALSAVGAVLVWWPELLEKFGYKKKVWRVFSWFFFLFAVTWTLSAGFFLVSRDYAASQELERGNCSVVEGVVENFHPMPKSGHDTERFEVNGVHFSYSDYVMSPGFNNTASHGGPIRDGLQVRICHNSGDILRLEVAR
jgi:hypothetical protein